jgi:peroxiredoxin
MSRVRVRVLVCVLFAIAIAPALACSGEDSSGKSPPASASSESTKQEPPKQESPKKPPRAEKPLPAFSGWTLDDQRLDISTRIGKRLVVYFFEPANKVSGPVSDAVVRIAKLGGDYNFDFVGVAIGSDRAKAKSHATEHGIAFPVIDDSSRRISQRLGLDVPAALIGVDAEGYVVWAIGQFPAPGSETTDVIESQIRKSLRLPEEDDAVPGDRPTAPQFTATVLDQKERFDLSAKRGRPVLLLFFLHTCPHCHEALEYLKTALADMPEDKRPVLVGLELTGRTDVVRSALHRDGLDFFPVIFDDGGKIQNAYGSFAGVPDLVMIDRDGRIAHRMQGWIEEVDGPLLRMRMAKLAGAPVPMLLRAKGYSGSQACGVCHETQHETWELTKHAHAFSTLVTHGADSNGECVSCHVVGFGQEGGFDLTTKASELENVGCESCHGRGGPHLSPGAVVNGDYEKACLACHDTKHSLGFEYATFLPKVSHAANAHILSMPKQQRQKIMAERGALRTDLLPTAARHVGSDACRSCHAAEYESWAAGPHARALATLEAKHKTGDANCLKCHTTGFGREGGFQPGAGASVQPDFARVGCESCHGPGGDHLGAEKKIGTIVSLGDKCDSCVILQICGSCHDDANDPGFEFEVKAKIDKIRHGTIGAGTGKPLAPGKAPTAALEPETSSLLAQAFAERDRRRAE